MINRRYRMSIILASTSPSRKKLLEKLGIAFTVLAPNCDETPLPGEDPVSLVLRLSKQKAESVAHQTLDSVIIGSDQVGEYQGQILGKPLTAENACKQLHNCSGQTLNFYTGLTVLNTKTKQSITLYEPFEVTFRKLTSEEINAYVSKENPLHCAGSFKCDALGITLFKQLNGADIHSLIGLPLIQLNRILIEMGYNPLMRQC